MAVVGGTASVLGGGKFASGAMAGAFMQMFNAEIGPTREKAEALKALKSIYSNSLKKGMEMGGFIYKTLNGQYLFLHAGENASTHHLDLNPAKYLFPKGSIIVATYHTHPALFTDNGSLLDTEVFSQADYTYGDTHQLNMYLGTYGGSFSFIGNDGEQYNYEHMLR